MRRWRCVLGAAPGLPAFAAAPLFLMLILAGSCDDEDPATPCPDYAIGAFEGSVLAGGVGAEAIVGARAAGGELWGSVPYQTRADSTGHYRLEVPSGTYWLEANPDTRGLLSPGLGDTLCVTNRVRPIDLLCGRILVRLSVPARLEGRAVSAVLKTRRFSLNETAVASAGHLDYVFPIVQAETCQFGIEMQYYRPTYWLPGTFDDDSADVIAVPLDQPLILEHALERYASISGTVHGSWQATGTSYVDVEARGAYDSTLVAWSRTKSDGSFTLDILSARPVKVRVEIGGVERWVGGDAFQTAQVFDLHADEQVDGIAIVESGILCFLEGPGSLTSHNARVLVRDEFGRDHGGGTSYSEPIAICNLDPGRYYLHVSGDCDYASWGSQWYDGATSFAQATPIDVGEGALVPVAVHLSPGGGIAGHLLTAEGAPAGYAKVVIVGQDDAFGCTHWVQERDLGAFHFQGLGDGIYRVAAEGSDGLWWFPGTADPDSARAIEVIDHAQVTGIDWRLP